MPTSPESVAKAEALLEQHGERTLQVLVDLIVAAVREGNEDKLTDLNRLMRSVEIQVMAKPSTDRSHLASV